MQPRWRPDLLKPRWHAPFGGPLVGWFGADRLIFLFFKPGALKKLKVKKNGGSPASFSTSCSEPSPSNFLKPGTWESNFWLAERMHNSNASLPAWPWKGPRRVAKESSLKWASHSYYRQFGTMQMGSFMLKRASAVGGYTTWRFPAGLRWKFTWKRGLSSWKVYLHSWQGMGKPTSLATAMLVCQRRIQN